MHWALFRRLIDGAATGGLGLLILLGPAVFPAQAALDPDEISEHVLANGMKVLLWEDQAIPNLAIYTFWKVGSRNEMIGGTGLAHFFEHMMFNGSEEYGPGEFDRVMEGVGGANNAYTSQDVTAYQDWIPASTVELILDLEADRISALAVDPQMVESERGVVMSERKSGLEEDNHSLMWEQLNATAFLAHPYAWPILGWRSDIEAWRQEDVEAFFHSWYTPNNALMVICGAFDEKTLLPLLEEKIGSLPAREIPRGVVTVEPEQRGERRAILRKEAALSSVLVAWHVPETAHQDLRVLELIDLILDSGESSRLYTRLVDEDQIALWTYVGTDDHFDPGLFEILIQCREGIAGATAESALYEEIENLKQEPVPERELAKAKNIIIADFYRQLASISGRAGALGTFELFHGDWRKLFDQAACYEAIDAEEITRVARTYLIADNRTVVTHIPTGAASEEGSDAN